MLRILQSAIAEPHRSLAVVLAGYASDDGRGIWVGAKTLALLLQRQPAVVTRQRKDLQDRGLLPRDGFHTVIETGRLVPQWRLDLDKFDSLPKRPAGPTARQLAAQQREQDPEVKKQRRAKALEREAERRARRQAAREAADPALPLTAAETSTRVLVNQHNSAGPTSTRVLVNQHNSAAIKDLNEFDLKGIEGAASAAPIDQQLPGGRGRGKRQAKASTIVRVPAADRHLYRSANRG